MKLDTLNGNTANTKSNTETNMNTNLIQFQILNKIMEKLSFIKTGDKFVDDILTIIFQGLILTIISGLTMNLGSIFKRLDIFKLILPIKLLVINFYYFILYKFFKKEKVIYKTVDISYITPNKEINELYKALHWYLSNNQDIDYLNEKYLQFFYKDKINIENCEKLKKNLSINKLLTQNKSKSIKYKNREITYMMSKELITLYSDKERKKENPRITLSSYIYELDKTDIIEDFCTLCLNEYMDSYKVSEWFQNIYTHQNGEWSPTPSKNYRKFETIALKNNMKNIVKNDLDLFLKSEEWYLERDIPYKRGYLFYGPPGTGKTSMIKAISLYAKRHIHYLMLSEIENDTELIDLLKNINYEKTVLVIEDIDTMSEIVLSRDKQKNDKDDKDDKDDKKERNLTLSGLLNSIDGMFSSHGQILIMTSNKPKLLDKALLRPGRCDRKINFDNCTKDQIRELFYLYFNKKLDDKYIKDIEEYKYSPAHIAAVFQIYRDDPEEAFNHLDDENDFDFI